MPPIKIFIDSAQRVDGSNSSFSFSLPRPVSIEKPYKAMVDQIHVPHVFQTIHANNKALYLEETSTPGPITAYHKVFLDPGQYDGNALAAHLKSKLDLATDPSITWTITFDPDQGHLTFAVAGGSCRIYPMRYLLKNPSAAALFQVGNHDDAGQVIGLAGDEIYGPIAAGATLTGTHISTLPYHTLYLHCDMGLGTAEDAVGPNGNGTCLRCIPVTTGYGQMLHDLSLNPHDYTLIQRGQIQVFKFRLTDRLGNDINLTQPFSFSIILAALDEFE